MAKKTLTEDDLSVNFHALQFLDSQLDYMRQTVHDRLCERLIELGKPEADTDDMQLAWDDAVKEMLWVMEQTNGGRE